MLIADIPVQHRLLFIVVALVPIIQRRLFTVQLIIIAFAGVALCITPVLYQIFRNPVFVLGLMLRATLQIVLFHVINLFIQQVAL